MQSSVYCEVLVLSYEFTHIVVICLLDENPLTSVKNFTFI